MKGILSKTWRATRGYFLNCSLFALRCQEFLIYIKRNCVPAYWLHSQIRLVWFVYYNTAAKVCSWNYYKKWNSMSFFTASCYISQQLLNCAAYRFYWGIDSRTDECLFICIKGVVTFWNQIFRDEHSLASKILNFSINVKNLFVWMVAFYFAVLFWFCLFVCLVFFLIYSLQYGTNQGKITKL